MKIEGMINQLKIDTNQLLKTEKQKDSKFDNVLGSFIEEVKKSNAESVKATNDFIIGGNTEIHEVMIAAEKAKTDLMLLTEIRNKALDTYNELTRMQV